MDIFVDSGAPTLYNTLIRRNKKSGVMGAVMEERKYDDFSFLDTPEYLEYRENYIHFLKSNSSKIMVYANLDIINNPEATWENQKYMERKGLNPIPVFHFGSDVKWLERYLREGYKYIAMGGMIPNSFSVLKEPLDDLWINHLTDKDGYPLVKVHGFAVTSARLVHRYPWYSVDSTSWVKFGMYGSIIIPRKTLGKYDYSKPPIILFLSIRSPQKNKEGKHISTLSKYERKEVESYIKSKGFVLGSSKFIKKKPKAEIKPNETVVKKSKRYIVVERIIEKGVCNDNILRDTLNAMYFVDLGNSVPSWPWPITFKKRGFI